MNDISESEANSTVSNNKFLPTLGLCAKAGKLICGTDLICSELHGGNKKIKLVLEASDTSDNTHKKITDKCRYYSIQHIKTEFNAITLGRAVGKSRPVAAAAVTDAELCKLILCSSGQNTL